MKLAATGHRPDKLVPGLPKMGYERRVMEFLIDVAAFQIYQLRPEEVITGMALGWDTAVTIAAIRARDTGMPLRVIAAVPFEGQESRWPEDSQARYRRMLAKVDETHVIDTECPTLHDVEGYSAEKMQRRNEWMVRRADKLLALWNGTRGGTFNCITFAEKMAVPVRNLWQLWTSHLLDYMTPVQIRQS